MIFGNSVQRMCMVKRLKSLIFADTILIDSLRACGGCAAIASEEHDDIVYFEEELTKNAQYLIR